MMYYSDIIGLIGVTLTLIAYFLLQIQRIASESIAYSLYNTLGSVLILYSLLNKWNLSAFIMESAWLLMSLYGVYTAYLARKHLTCDNKK